MISRLSLVGPYQGARTPLFSYFNDVDNSATAVGVVGVSSCSKFGPRKGIKEVSNRFFQYGHCAVCG